MCATLRNYNAARYSPMYLQFLTFRKVAIYHLWCFCLKNKQKKDSEEHTPTVTEYQAVAHAADTTHKDPMFPLTVFPSNDHLDAVEEFICP